MREYNKPQSLTVYQADSSLPESSHSETPSPPGEKLHKVLAAAGLGSRRAMEQAIEEGRVKVNGKRAQVGMRITREDRVDLDRKKIRFPEQQPQCRVLLYNKPEGEICSRSDHKGRPTVFDKLPKLKGERWISVGRLDINTSGLLLFTNQGELANALMHPSSEIDREYLVRIQGEADDDMKARLKEGVQLDDGIAKFTDVVNGRGQGTNHWYYCVLMEGRNREVRRLWESQGLQVNRLKRVRFGSVFLPSRLKVGQWMELGEKEIKLIGEMAGEAWQATERTPQTTQTDKKLRVSSRRPHQGKTAKKRMKR